VVLLHVRHVSLSNANFKEIILLDTKIAVNIQSKFTLFIFLSQEHRNMEIYMYKCICLCVYTMVAKMIRMARFF